MTKPRPLHLVLGGTDREAPAIAMEQRLRRIEASSPPPWLSPEKKGTAPAAAPPPPAPAAPPPPTREEQERLLEEAKRAAVARGLAEAKAQVDAVVDKYLQGIESLARARREAARNDVADMVSVAMTIAKAVLARELKTDPEALLFAVDEAIGSFTPDEPLRLRIGPSDLATLRERRPELLRHGIEVIEDPALDAGGCTAENARRVVDATLKTRLADIEAALRESFARGDA